MTLTAGIGHYNLDNQKHPLTHTYTINRERKSGGGRIQAIQRGRQKVERRNCSDLSRTLIQRVVFNTIRHSPLDVFVLNRQAYGRIFFVTHTAARAQNNLRLYSHE